MMEKKSSVGVIIVGSIICLAASLFSPFSAYAEKVYLKNGEVFEGEIIEKTDEYVKIKMGEIRLPIFTNRIDKIEGDSGVIFPKEERMDKIEKAPEIIFPEKERIDKIDKIQETIWSREENIYKTETETYKNPYFTIDYPSDWQKIESGWNMVYFKHLPGGTVGVTVEDIGSKYRDLEHYAQVAWDLVSKVMGGKVSSLEKGRTRINNKEARFNIFTTDIQSKKIKTKSYVLIVDTKGYGITYSCEVSYFDKYLPEAENIIKSFRLSSN